MSGYEADDLRSAANSSKQFQILCRLVDTIFQIIVIGPDEGISEVPCIFSKNVVGHIKAKGPQIFDEEHCCCPGISLSKHVDLPKPRNEYRKVMNNLVH